MPKRRDGRGFVIGLRHLTRQRRKTRIASGGAPNLGALSKAARQRHHAGGCAGDCHAGWEGARQEGRKLGVPHRARAVVPGKMHVRIPAARHPERIDLQRLVAVLRLDRDGAERLAAGGFHHFAARDDADRPGGRAHRGRDLRPAVDDRGDVDAGSRQVASGSPTVVVVGEDRGASTGRDRVSVGVGP